MVVEGNKIALHQQLAQTIRQRIRTGVYQSGERLPSVRALRDEFNVSVNVVYRAVRDLEESGVVVTHQGRGMTIQDGPDCSGAAILFGFIQPYDSSFSFQADLYQSAGQVFDARSNFLVVRSSEGSAERERQVAMHLINNGVKGLMIWPVENDPNAAFFAEVARTTPVVVVDRVMDNSDLPTVVHDYYRGCRDICHRLLGELGRRKMLVLMDDLDVPTYADMERGLRDEAAELGQSDAIEIQKLPISQFVKNLGHSFFSQVQTCKQAIEPLLGRNDYDAFFCTNGEVIDYVLMGTDLQQRCASMTMAMVCGTTVDPNLTRLREMGVLQWYLDEGEMISRAANLLQTWVMTHKAPRGVVQVGMRSNCSCLHRS